MPRSKCVILLENNRVSFRNINYKQELILNITVVFIKCDSKREKLERQDEDGAG